MRSSDRNYAGFNFFSPPDLRLMEVRIHLPDRSTGQISKLLKRLCLHGVVHKSGPRYQYFLTPFGKDAIALGLKLR